MMNIISFGTKGLFNSLNISLIQCCRSVLGISTIWLNFMWACIGLGLFVGLVAGGRFGPFMFEGRVLLRAGGRLGPFMLGWLFIGG